MSERVYAPGYDRPCMPSETCTHVVTEEVDEAIVLWFTPPAERTESGEAQLREVETWNPCAQLAFFTAVQRDPRTAARRERERESEREYRIR